MKIVLTRGNFGFASPAQPWTHLGGTVAWSMGCAYWPYDPIGVIRDIDLEGDRVWVVWFSSMPGYGFPFSDPYKPAEHSQPFPTRKAAKEWAETVVDERIAAYEARR